jgi:hypothetical protein
LREETVLCRALRRTTGFPSCFLGPVGALEGVLAIGLNFLLSARDDHVFLWFFVDNVRPVCSLGQQGFKELKSKFSNPRDGNHWSLQAKPLGPAVGGGSFL